MGHEPKVSPSTTYILDDEDIDQLDALSLTSVIRDATNVPELEPPEEPAPGIDDLEFDILSSED